jgi:hypothetical protein
MTNREREQELAGSVQSTRARLLALLTADEQRTRRHEGSAHATTFEDHAREVADHKADPRSPKVFLALAEFQSCVNALWTHAIACQVPERLAAGWLKKHRGLNRGRMYAQDVEAEALVELRRFVVLFVPGQGASLETYATRGVHQRLTEWAAQQGSIELPRAAARETGPEHYQRGIDNGQLNPDERGVHVQPEHEWSHNPTDVLNRCIDAERADPPLRSDGSIDLARACPDLGVEFCPDCPYKTQCDREIENA